MLSVLFVSLCIIHFIQFIQIMAVRDNKKADKNNQEIDPNSRNLLGPGTTITGEINSDGVFRLDGTLNGNLTTKAKLVIGKSGVVKGDIQCKNADVSGKVEGKIIVSELLSLKADCSIKGDIITNKLSIEPGANFDGTCDMSGESKTGTGADANANATPLYESKKVDDSKQSKEKPK